LIFISQFFAVVWKAELYVVYTMPYSSYQCCFKYLDAVRYGRYVYIGQTLRQFSRDGCICIL